MKPRLNTLIFEVTQRCNHACLHCYNVWHLGELAYPRGELGTPETLALLEKALDETGCQHVTLTGGEPLLRKDLPLILDMLCSRDVGASIISNGRLLTEPVLLELLECGADLFELPLLSYRREVHDDLSGSQGAFDAVLAAMAQLGTHGGTFVATFVLTQLNCTDLRDTIKLAYAFGAHGLMLNRFNPGGRGIKHIKMLLPTAGQVQEALSIAEATSVELGFPISCSIPIQPCLLEGVSDKTDNQRLFPHLNFGFCAVGTDRAYYTLDSLGNLRPCNHTPTILGNLFDESFSDLIAPERLRFFTRSIPSFCDGCILREICQGGCKAAAQVCYGSLTAEEPFLHNNKGKGVGDEG